jgi:hypothetical protein
MGTSLLQHAKHYLSGKLTGDQTVPFHFLVNEKWDRGLLYEYQRAKVYDRQVDKDALRRVWVMSYSCSGSHNFYTHFHYMPGVFALGENQFIDKANDPFQFRFMPSQLRPAHFLYGSAFLEQGLQEKDGTRLSHIFLLSNHYLKYDKPVDMSALAERDSLLFYQRNFLRVLFSQNRDGHKFSKPHFVLTDEYFAKAVASHRKRIDEMVHLVEKHPETVYFCSHEKFCASPYDVMMDLSGKVGIDSKDTEGWDAPEAFFARCYRSRAAPVVKDGALWCEAQNKPVYGKGGEYNPLPAISLERTISAPIKEWYTGDRLAIVRKAFGEELVEFWLEDQSFDYATASQESLTKLLERGLVAGQDLNAG